MTTTPSQEFDVTLSSRNEELYAYVWGPPNRVLEVTCTSFTCQSSIVILEPSDYITVNGQRYYFDDTYIEMDEESFLIMLNQMLGGSTVIVEATTEHLLKFSSDTEFEIDSMSYNVKLLTGMFWDKVRRGTCIVGDCVPYYNSTPVLYLVSNLGATNYTNVTNETSACTGMTTSMKINTTGSRSVNIIAGNCDFVAYTNSNLLTNCHFLLVDQNLHRIKLLNPFTITIKIRIVEDVI